jgi:hypothetical protein
MAATLRAAGLMAAGRGGAVVSSGRRAPARRRLAARKLHCKRLNRTYSLTGCGQRVLVAIVGMKSTANLRLAHAARTLHRMRSQLSRLGRTRRVPR